MWFLFALFWLFSPLISQGQYYKLKGKILDLTSNEPVPNVQVRLLYEDYSMADTIRETIRLDPFRSDTKDTVYLNPKKKLIDSTFANEQGCFEFTVQRKGLYTVYCRIKKLEIGYKTEGVDHVEINSDTATVLLTPKTFCEYAKYQGQDSCPVCLRKDKCLKVIYGLPVYDPDETFPKKGEFWIGYCDPDPYCFARWYCTRCDKLN